MTVRTPFAADVRAAAVDLLTGFAADVGIGLQVYRARPRSIHPPTAFVDQMSEVVEYPGIVQRQRRTRAEVLVLHGLYDSGDTVDQRDAFVDGFLDWVTDDVHAAGPDSLLALVGIDDDPTYVPEWVDPAVQRTYYATRLVLEGYIGNT